MARYWAICGEEMMMLMAAYAASAGGIGTPVGSRPNLMRIAMIERFVKVKIPFFQWMLFVTPLLIAMYILLYFLMYVLHKPEVARVEGSDQYVKKELKELGKWTPWQKISLVAFLVAVALWIIPGFLAVIYGTASSTFKSYNIRASILSLLP